MCAEARTATSTTLLQGLFDLSNEPVWEEFDARYRPIILSFAQRLGLSEADAADVAQETLVCFVQEYREGKYERGRGRLRTWLMAILRYRVADFRRARNANPVVTCDSELANEPEDDRLTSLWEAERRRALMIRALAEVRHSSKTSDKTLQAFEMYVLQEVPAQTVAQQLGMTLRDVYMAKNRVAERLRDILSKLDDLFDDG